MRFIQRSVSTAYADGVGSWRRIADAQIAIERGRVHPIDVEGVALLIVGDGQHVRVFHNVCQHRGHPLRTRDGQCDALVCPLHGWRYALDGSLEHVPDREAFPELDASEAALSELPSRLHDGGVEVLLPHGSPTD